MLDVNNRLSIEPKNAVSPRFPARDFVAGKRLKGYFLFLVVLASVAAVACTQGSYPVDIFYEMHYQQSYKSHEPPRLSAPESSVAFFPPPQSTGKVTSTGEHLFAVNCSMCHGSDAKGDGPVLQKLIATYGYTPIINPPDLTDNPPESITGLLLSVTRPFGDDSVMPPFGKLLNETERNAIAEYISTLPK